MFLFGSSLVHGQDAEPATSPAPVKRTRTWRAKIAILLGSLCGRNRKLQLGGATTNLHLSRNSSSRTSSCMHDRARAADTGGPQLSRKDDVKTCESRILTTSSSFDSEWRPSNPRDQACSCSASGNGSVSKVMRCRPHSTLGSTTASPAQLLSRNGSSSSCQANDCNDPAFVMTRTLHTSLLQQHLSTQAIELQPISFSRQLSNASHSSKHRTERSLESPSGAGQPPQISHPSFDFEAFRDKLDNEAGISKFYPMQPYEEEEERTWQQIQWKQQQDWLEQKDLVELFSPRHYLWQGSRSLNVRSAQQSSMLLMSGDIEQERNAHLSSFS